MDREEAKSDTKSRHSADFTLTTYTVLLFRIGLEDDYKSDREEAKSDTESSHSEEEDDQVFDKLENSKPAETPYVENKIEELGQVHVLRKQPMKYTGMFKVVKNENFQKKIFGIFFFFCSKT